MIVIDNKIISEDVADEYFACDLSACHGVCCVEGDTGAPIEIFETEIMEHIYPIVEPYLTEEGKQAIKEQGIFVLDKEDGVFKTPLIKGKACAYTIKENGVVWCGIEKAWFEKKVEFRKPVSCHLYPIRIDQNEHFDAVNYEEWDICKAACSLGKKQKMPVYKFVKDALIRKYGEAFYNTLEATIEHMKSKD